VQTQFVADRSCRQLSKARVVRNFVCGRFIAGVWRHHTATFQSPTGLSR